MEDAGRERQEERVGVRPSVAGERGLDQTLALLSAIIPAISLYLTLPSSIDFGRAGNLAAVAFGADPSFSSAGPLWGPWARTWLAVLPTEPTQALHLISLIPIALSSAIVYLLASRAIRALSGGGHPGYGGGFIAALSFAWLDTVWSTGTTVAAEAPGTLCGLVGLLMLFRWYRQRVSPNRAGRLSTWYGPLGLLMIGVGGLLTWQVFALLPGAALLLWFRFNSPSDDPLLRPRHVAAGLGAAVGLLLLWGIAVFTLSSKTGTPVDAEIMNRTAATWSLPSRFDSAGEEREGYEGDLTAVADPSGPSVGGNYTRYLLWNLVGRMSSHDDAPALLFSVNPVERSRFIDSIGGEDRFPILFYAIPLLLALIGLVRQIRHDWRGGLVMVTSFLASGFVLAFAASDSSIPIDTYFALSFAFPALWIGIGAGGCVEGLMGVVREEEPETPEGGERETNIRRGVLLLVLLAGPVNLIYNGWDLHGRGGVSFAEDFGTNMLRSCDRDALLLVEGDELGGLLLYLQEAKGVREDVMVVEIERLASPEYRSLLSARSEAAGRDYDLWGEGNRRISGWITEDTVRRLPLLFPKSSEGSDTTSTGVGGDRLDTTTWSTSGFTTPAGFHLYTVATDAMERLIVSSIPERPVCLAITVDPIFWSGLDRFFVWSGLVYRLASPRVIDRMAGATSVSRYPVDRERMRELLAGDDEPTAFRLEGLDNPSLLYRPSERSRVAAYRRAWIALAASVGSGSEEQGESPLRKMDEEISLELFPMNYWTAAATAILAKEEGLGEFAEKYARHAVEEADALGESWRTDPIARDYNPYQITATMQALLGDYDGAIERYSRLVPNPDADPIIRGLIEELRVKRHLATKDTSAALDELDAIIHGYEGAGGSGLIENREAWEEYREELKK